MSDLLTRLIEAGTPPALVAEVAQQIAMAEARVAVAAEAIEGRRARDRARQNKRRGVDAHEVETPTDNVTSRDITLPTVTKRDPLSLPPNENISNPPTHTPGNNTRARKGTETPAKPDGVTPETWRDFLDLRKRKGAPLTETALKGISREASKAGWPLEAALEKCVVRGWQGFETAWLNGDKPPSAATSAANDDPLTRRLMARKAREAPA